VNAEFWLKARMSEAEDVQHLEEVGFLTSMVLTLLGNYSQTGHFGGPLAYTPANVILHLGGADKGGLSYDIRNPKHPLSDKYMLAGGHCAPTNYALWIVLYEALARQHKATGDNKFAFDPHVALLGIDALGFRRSPDATRTLLQDFNLADDPLFEQHKIRGIRALMGHSETTDVTNDVNGGPSGIGVANTSGKALFWDSIGAPKDLKIWVFEGEFAFTEGHAQELKTMALAQQNGKRVRLFFSWNNAGIDDALVGQGGVIHEKFAQIYDMVAQFSSYGWNVFDLSKGTDYSELIRVFSEIEQIPEDDLRPVVVIAHTVKGWWPAVVDGKVDSSSHPEQVVGHKSHPYGFQMNSPYFVALAESFERRFGVQFQGIRDGAPQGEQARLKQFIGNVQVALSVLDQNEGKLRNWVSSRLVQIAENFTSNRVESEKWARARSHFEQDTFSDARLKVENLPREPIEVTTIHPTTGKEVKTKILLYQNSGIKFGARRAVSEIGKWINYVTGNRFFTIAADLSNSINVEAASLTGHYDPVSNPHGTRLKAGIQEACNACTVAGLASQTLSTDPNTHLGFWGVSGTYGAFTPLMYTPMRIFSQQNQDSPFALGVVTIIAGHSGPETAADGRSHFGIFAPQVWTLFPRNQIINLYFWDYNDVAPGYFAALQIAQTRKETGIICVHVARPDSPVADRNTFADKDINAAAKGAYLIREFDPSKPKSGTVFVQGSSSTVNLVGLFDKLDAENLNVRIVSVISEELFRAQPQEYQDFIYPDSARLDSMVITTFTKRVPVLAGLGPLAEEYTLSSDFDDRWRTGGLEPDVIAEAHLDSDSILQGIRRFVSDRETRLNRLRAALSGL